MSGLFGKLGGIISNTFKTGFTGGIQLLSGNPVGAFKTAVTGGVKSFQIASGRGVPGTSAVPRYPGFSGPTAPASASPALAGGRGRQDMINGKCPAGYHPAKDGHGCVRNRHMNFGNGRATGRAIRRIHGAEKQFRHIFHMTHPGKKGGRVAFNRKKR